MSKDKELEEVLEVCLRELEDWNRGHEPSEGQLLARDFIEKHAKKDEPEKGQDKEGETQ